MIPHSTIEIFSPLWWKANLIIITIISIIVIIGKKTNIRNKEIIAKVMGLIFIFRSIGIHFYLLSIGNWQVESALPLHLCGLSAILSGVVMFWRNQYAYECLYYWGICGAFHSFLTPEFTLGTEGILFYEYYLSHGGIIFSALYLTLVLGMKPRKKSWLQIFLFSQLLFPIIGFINWLIDSNYMYLCIKPIADNPFLIGEWPWYIIGLNVAAILHFAVIYLPFHIYYKINESSEPPPII